MAEFCLDCWHKINGEDIAGKKYVLTRDLFFCEECCEWKRVVIAERWHYYMYKFRYIIFPFRILGGIIYFFWRLSLLPFFIYKYMRRKSDNSILKEKTQANYSTVLKRIE